MTVSSHKADKPALTLSRLRGTVNRLPVRPLLVIAIALLSFDVVLGVTLSQ